MEERVSEFVQLLASGVSHLVSNVAADHVGVNSPNRADSGVQMKLRNRRTESILVRMSRAKAIWRILTAAFFVFAGVMHFIKPHFYRAMMPSMLPHPLELIYISGMAEILGGAGLLIPKCRRLAAYGLITLLIAVFPANIKMFADSLHDHGWSLTTLILTVRLPLQFAFMALVNWVGKNN